ncbi:MAG: type II toxin-antitoxin system VapB family antitoxin [Kiritimatiellia bacterium]
MRTTLNIDDEILVGVAPDRVKQEVSLVRMGLEALIARSSAQRLAALGETEPQAPCPRRPKMLPCHGIPCGRSSEAHEAYAS